MLSSDFADLFDGLSTVFDALASISSGSGDGGSLASAS